MKIAMPALPYDLDALAPTISKKALKLHYEGHLKGYVNALNRLPSVAGSEKKKLEELVIEGKHEKSKNLLGILPPGEHSSTLFNLAGQVYNHTFFFRSMSPLGGDGPKGDFKEVVNAQYESWENFKKRLIAKGKTLFGSGWIWICLDDEGNLLILKGLDAETPLVYRELSPILCIDVWEHAYYLDYNMNRGKYIEAVADNLLNWEFANKNLAKA